VGGRHRRRRFLIFPPRGFFGSTCVRRGLRAGRGRLTWPPRVRGEAWPPVWCLLRVGPRFPMLIPRFWGGAGAAPPLLRRHRFVMRGFVKKTLGAGLGRRLPFCGGGGGFWAEIRGGGGGKEGRGPKRGTVVGNCRFYPGRNFFFLGPPLPPNSPHGNGRVHRHRRNPARGLEGQARRGGEPNRDPAFFFLSGGTIGAGKRDVGTQHGTGRGTAAAGVLPSSATMRMGSKRGKAVGRGVGSPEGGGWHGLVFLAGPRGIYPRFYRLSPQRVDGGGRSCFYFFGTHG